MARVMVGGRFGRSLLAGALVGLGMTGVTAARAEGALRRYEEPHKSSASSSSSDSSCSSCSSSSSTGRDILSALFSGLFSGGSSSSSSTSSDAAPAVEPRSSLELRRPATSIYDGDRQGAYVKPFVLDANDNVVRQSWTRSGELKTSAFLALNEEVVAHDACVNGFLGFFMIGAGWERFYEPNRAARTVDTLDTFRFRLGPNILGASIPILELYTLAGASVLHGFGDTIPAFDLALEARAYPLRPLAFYASGTTSFFADGPPILEGRMEGGVSVGRVDVRAGYRMLRQNPEQSFVGPVASLVLRL